MWSQREVIPGGRGNSQGYSQSLGYSNIIEQLRNAAIKEISSSKTCQKLVIRFNPLAGTYTTNSVSNSKKLPLSSDSIQS